MTQDSAKMLERLAQAGVASHRVQLEIDPELATRMPKAEQQVLSAICKIASGSVFRLGAWHYGLTPSEGDLEPEDLIERLQDVLCDRIPAEAGDASLTVERITLEPGEDDDPEGAVEPVSALDGTAIALLGALTECASPDPEGQAVIDAQYAIKTSELTARGIAATLGKTIEENAREQESLKAISAALEASADAIGQQFGGLAEQIRNGSSPDTLREILAAVNTLSTEQSSRMTDLDRRIDAQSADQGGHASAIVSKLEEVTADQNETLSTLDGKIGQILSATVEDRAAPSISQGIVDIAKLTGGLADQITALSSAQKRVETGSAAQGEKQQELIERFDRLADLAASIKSDQSKTIRKDKTEQKQERECLDRIDSSLKTLHDQVSLNSEALADKLASLSSPEGFKNAAAQVLEVLEHAEITNSQRHAGILEEISQLRETAWELTVNQTRVLEVSDTIATEQKSLAAERESLQQLKDELKSMMPRIDQQFEAIEAQSKKLSAFELSADKFDADIIADRVAASISGVLSPLSERIMVLEQNQEEIREMMQAVVVGLSSLPSLPDEDTLSLGQEEIETLIDDLSHLRRGLDGMVGRYRTQFSRVETALDRDHLRNIREAKQIRGGRRQSDVSLADMMAHMNQKDRESSGRM